MNRYVWLDNKLITVKSKDSVLFDEGFLYGQGLFETMRSYSQKAFLLERHLKRLIDSCKSMDIKPPNSRFLENAVEQAIKRNKMVSGYVRLTVWKAEKSTRISVFTKAAPFYNDKDYKKGLKAVIIRDTKVNTESFLSQHKTLNYYLYVYFRKRAQIRRADEAILLNTKGFVCEGSRSNMFIVIKNQVFTPPVSSGCLPGVTRGLTLDLCRRLKIKAIQKQLKPAELYNSQEVFLTNSLIEIMPLVRIDDRPVGSATPGRITALLSCEYKNYIREYINSN